VLGEIDLVRALAMAGIVSAVVVQDGNPALYSRAVFDSIAWLDPSKEPGALVDRLLAFAATCRERPVLFYDGDWDLLLVSRMRERLAQGFRFVVADAELVEDVVDKARFQALAERLDLPVPRAVRLEPGGDAPDLRFPLLAKPLTRLHETWRPLAGAKAVHLQTPGDLRELRSRINGVEVLVQEVVPGPESRIESYHVYIDETGAVAGEFTGRKLRTHPPGYGYSTALTITNSPDVLHLGRELCERMGLRGVAKLDFKRDDRGRLHLFEVNPRFNLWHHPGALAGVNLPALVYADLTGRPRPSGEPLRPGVTWCSLAHDLQAARQDGLSALDWLRWVAACEAKSGFAWDDPLPLPRAMLWRLGRRLHNGEGVVRR
jgi:predicted ATP-grasp superfamily ATP-dependent carboligase